MGLSRFELLLLLRVPLLHLLGLLLMPLLHLLLLLLVHPFLGSLLMIFLLLRLQLLVFLVLLLRQLFLLLFVLLIPRDVGPAVDVRRLMRRQLLGVRWIRPGVHAARPRRLPSALRILISWTALIAGPSIAATPSGAIRGRMIRCSGCLGSDYGAPAELRRTGRSSHGRLALVG
jgi:hypothetical protein